MSLRTWVRQPLARYRAWRAAQARRRFERLLQAATHPDRVAQRRRENEEECGRLALDAAGFQLLNDGRPALAVRWADVRAIRAYKRDLLAYDRICLAFQIGDGRVEIHERMVDFLLVDEAMRKRFPGIPENWFSDVMLPAFATNDRVLWQHQA